jgi:hypothetical protein
MAVSQQVLNEFSKLNPAMRETLQGPARVSTKNVEGASRVVPAADMARKVSGHATVARPDPKAPSTTGPKAPPANWPKPAHGPFASGLAKSGAIGPK